MDRYLAFIRRILPFAFGGLVSLTIAQATDLGYQTLGNGPGAVAPVVGDSVGLLACGIAAVVAFRQIRGGALSRC